MKVHLGGRLFESPDNITILKADWNYTKIYFNDGSQKMVATTLGIIQQRLPKDLFFRINRSTIINLREIRIGQDKNLIEHPLIGNIPVSRRRKTQFYAMFNLDNAQIGTWLNIKEAQKSQIISYFQF